MVINKAMLDAFRDKESSDDDRGDLTEKEFNIVLISLLPDRNPSLETMANLYKDQYAIEAAIASIEAYGYNQQMLDFLDKAYGLFELVPSLKGLEAFGLDSAKQAISSLRDVNFIKKATDYFDDVLDLIRDNTVIQQIMSVSGLSHLVLDFVVRPQKLTSYVNEAVPVKTLENLINMITESFDKVIKLSKLTLPKTAEELVAYKNKFYNETKDYKNFVHYELNKGIRIAGYPMRVAGDLNKLGYDDTTLKKISILYKALSLAASRKASLIQMTLKSVTKKSDNRYEMEALSILLDYATTIINKTTKAGPYLTKEFNHIKTFYSNIDSDKLPYDPNRKK